MRHSLSSLGALAALLLSLSFAASAQPMGGRGRAGPGYTPGWSMMTPQEREQHRAQMRGATTQEECRKLMDEHHGLMEKRAQERDMRMRGPRGNACGGFGK